MKGKPINKKGRIILVFVIIAAVVGCFFILSNVRVGYEIPINIPDGITADAQYLVKKRAEALEDVAAHKVVEPSFDMLYEEDFNQLVNYMDKNNLRIKPGLYFVNRAARFKSLISAFEFESL